MNGVTKYIEPGAGMMRILGCIGFAAFCLGRAFGQSAGTQPKFEIADVHASAHTQIIGVTGFVNPVSKRGGLYRGGRYELRNFTMVDLISTAYGVRPEKVLGGPIWLEMDQFDITAAAPAETTPESLKSMLQTLLADRFKLVVHNDSKPLPAYAITTGPKPLLREADGSGAAGCKPQPNTTESPAALAAAGIRVGNFKGMAMRVDQPVLLSCRNITMSAFADELGSMAAMTVLGAVPVLDQTGLKGMWNFDVRLSVGNPAWWTERITIFDAFEKQLGLKLVPASVPTPVLVVDSVNEKPTANALGAAEKLPVLPSGFDLADIKPTDPGAIQQGSTGGGLFASGDRVTMKSLTLKTLIAQAWGLINADMVVGGPKYLDTNHFDITGKILVPVLADGKSAIGSQVDLESRRVMLQTLLKDRFKLVVHNEEQPTSGYVLVPTSKVKLKKADPSNRTKCVTGPGPDGKDPRIASPARNRLRTCLNVTIPQFLGDLWGFAPGYLATYPPIVDASGIEGAFDITLNFGGADSPRATGGPGGDAIGAAAAAPDPNGGISVFEAMESQLGLKLEMRKIPASFLVIDHVEEMPTEN